MVTPNNLAVTTLSTYSEDISSHMGYLLSSCEKFGINLEIAHFPGEQYVHNVHKLHHRLNHFKSLDKKYEYVLFVDARDAFFRRPLEAVCEAYNDFYADKIVIGAEKVSWPCDKAAWKDRFPRRIGNRNYINSGVFLGPRESVIDALEKFIHLKENAHNIPDMDDIRATLSTENSLRASSEQVYWQIALIMNLIDLELDAECRLVANITVLDDIVPSSQNKDYMIDENKRIMVRSSGCYPSIVHVPAKWNENILHSWHEYLCVQ